MQQRFPHDRQQRMAELIARRGSLTVSQLVDHFKSSAPTVRRDLALLEQAGLAARTHGGVMAPRTGDSIEPLFLEKLRLHHGIKRRIGRAAAAHAATRQTILIDSGTTALALAQELAGRALTIVTMDLKVAEAAAIGATQVHMLGGQVRNGYYSIVGSSTVQALEALSFDVFFMAADAIDADGVSNSTRDEADVKLAATARSRHTILMADHSKLGRRSLVSVCPLTRIHRLITDKAGSDRLDVYRPLIGAIELC